MTPPTGGWVKFHRQAIENGWLRNHRLWVFWSYCLLKASHKPTNVMIGYQQVALETGQFIFGREKAAKELRMTVKQLRTCLTSLKTANNLAVKTTNKFSIITIVKWNTYQNEEEEKGQQKGQQVGSRGASKGPAKGHIQEGEEEKNKTLSEFFEKLWEAYPRKDGRKVAERHYNATVKNESDMERINLALGNYLNNIEVNKTDQKFIKTGATWFNNWTDWEVDGNGK